MEKISKAVPVILSEFDPEKRAVVNPDQIYRPIPGFPDTIVSVFSHVLFDRLKELYKAEKIAEAHDVDGTFGVYSFSLNGRRLPLVKARLSAPVCVGTFEDVLAMGGKRIILFGNCGVLDRSIEDCAILIPRLAIRDEGTSYHYAPPSDTIEVNRQYGEYLHSAAVSRGFRARFVTTWTTDAFYRETPAKIARRKEMGADCVEMECAAMQALCDWRGIEFVPFFYAGDNLDSAEWQPRSLSGYSRLDIKEQIAHFACELAAALDQGAKDVP